jgi:Type VI secretion system, VipA, VC_A0107 or Hcp2
MARDRKFVETNPDKIDLTFKLLEDLEPQRIAEQVPAVKELLDPRTELGDLKGSFRRNPKFEEQLDEIVKNTEKRGPLASPSPVFRATTNKRCRQAITGRSCVSISVQMGGRWPVPRQQSNQIID